MTVQLTAAQEERFQDIASRNALTPDQVLRESVDRFLDHEEDLLLSVKHGNEDIATDRVHEHDEVVARIETMLEGR